MMVGYAMPKTRVFAEAYELKAGGFRGIAVELGEDNKAIGELRKSDVLPSLQDARNAAIKLANELVGNRRFAGGSYRNSKNRWRYNYWLT